MAPQLYYFDMKGLAEGIRYLLHYGGLEFEDVRVPRDDWPKLKEKIVPPFGKLPLYKDGNITIHQSSVIAKYVAKKIGLVPTDALKDAQADMVIQTLFDFFNFIRGLVTESDPVKKEEAKKVLLEEHIPFYFLRFDKQLAENKGYFTGELTWVDIFFVSMVETLEDFVPSKIQTDYTNIKTLVNKVHNLKGIKEYIAKRNK